MSTKIHVAANAAGHPLRILPTAGQVHEATQASTQLSASNPLSAIS
jgi:hypothetical protein